MKNDIHQDDMLKLHKAYELLENPGLRIKIMNTVGLPIEKGMELLPEDVNKEIVKISNVALTKAADVALFTLASNELKESSNWWHRTAVWGTGFFGGFGGFETTLLEVPISTMIMLRSILDIARSEGENLENPEARLSALQVFALGGSTASDDMADTAYYAVRMAMASEVNSALKFLTKGAGKLGDKNAPAIIQLIAKIASRFGVTVSEKTVAQAMPFIGGAIGVLVNDIFIAHYQDMARGHFIVRGLERKYGKDIIQKAYEGFKNAQ